MKMKEQQVREIARSAFNAHFDDIDVVRVNVEAGFDHYDDPMFEVTIIYDAEFEHLNAAGILNVRSEIVEKVWGNGEDAPAWPYVSMVAKSDIATEEGLAAVYG